ncbi:hypothetical protein COU77_02375 [Candidatus Peregrinibacteria bacterium CG10_big_fil_rev_8_21_14_0_10_49_16]|nr:MAG: hypothetical protein COW95_00860 [Candidatus Peregrinibacteria bacterium CG22_combo_CG10-13_8_21_14_all_49_11]PIR52057.1 MAG: hypothetical protein COU77_02375 [Candidatus Peregrinibacteria bacterium CG10_big_fil_rev_8_21_14_0_10_49_16]
MNIETRLEQIEHTLTTVPSHEDGNHLQLRQELIGYLLGEHSKKVTYLLSLLDDRTPPEELGARIRVLHEDEPIQERFYGP